MKFSSDFVSAFEFSSGAAKPSEPPAKIESKHTAETIDFLNFFKNNTPFYIVLDIFHSILNFSTVTQKYYHIMVTISIYFFIFYAKGIYFLEIANLKNNFLY